MVHGLLHTRFHLLSDVEASYNKTLTGVLVSSLSCCEVIGDAIFLLGLGWLVIFFEIYCDACV